jgi:hypothetical protein
MAVTLPKEFRDFLKLLNLRNKQSGRLKDLTDLENLP